MYKYLFIILLIAFSHQQQVEILQLNQQSFDQYITNDPQQMWMVMFQADWCDHCHKLRPQFIKAAELMKTYGVKFAFVNEKGNNRLTSKYVADPVTHRLAYPALVVILGDQVLGRVPGHLVNSYSIRFWFLNYFKIVDENSNGQNNMEDL